MFLYKQSSTLGAVRINTGGTEQIRVLQSVSATSSDNTQKRSEEVTYHGQLTSPPSVTLPN